MDHIGLNDGSEYSPEEEAAIWQRVGDTLNEVNVDKAVEKVIAEIKEEFEAGTLSEEQAERRREHARQVGLEKALELTGKSATNNVARPDPVYLTEEEAVIKKRIQASWARIEVDRRLDTAISEIGEGVEAGLIPEMQAEGHREYAHQLGEELFLKLAGTESEPTGSAS
jgi:hypothetical protein